jgi:heavy metal sensor kinase
MDRQLRDDFEMVESRVARDSVGNLRWLGYGHDKDEVQWEKQAGPWFEILSPAGSILLREGPSSDWETISSLTHREDAVAPFSAEMQRHLHVRVLENSTRIAGESVVLRVFRSEAELRRAMAELGAVLAFGLPLAVALSAAGGYLIAHRSLSPMSQIAARARQITAESLGGRLPVPNPHDELGQLATVFNATLARLENSFAELRRFTADASHELRTPLTALRAVGEAALRPDAGDSKSLREALSSMLEETRRLSDLVDALLLLARADTSGVSPSLEQVDLTGLVNEVRETLLVLAEEKNQQIEIIAEQLTIRADRELLRLALLNLVHNAIRYSAEGLMISLRVRRQEANAVVEVTDQGPGIAPEHQQKIFERFYRVDKARSRASGGAGLGLAIARWAIERQGGHVELESELGRGSLFRIVMPR